MAIDVTFFETEDVRVTCGTLYAEKWRTSAILPCSAVAISTERISGSPEPPQILGLGRVVLYSLLSSYAKWILHLILVRTHAETPVCVDRLLLMGGIY